ncbi:MAG: AAA family ATPase [Vulcanimicrobiaceae bacterium]
MANGKFCAARSGGSARGCLRYILGYALGLKGEEQRESYRALMEESLGRADFGAGALWRPSVGDGTRPSAIYAHGVTSLATADLEMEAVARANTRVQIPVHHLVISFGDQDRGVTDEQIAAFSRRVLEKIGAGEHQYVISIHRDTDHPHAHIALGAVNPYTVRVLDRYHCNSRLHWALRETEIEMGLHHDRGLAMVRENEDGGKRVEWATYAERRTWRREAAEHRLDDLLVRAVGDYADFETPESWVEQVLEPKLRDVLTRAKERNEPFAWADLHAVAARYGVRLEESPVGAYQLAARIRERVEPGKAGEPGKDRTVPIDGFEYKPPLEPRARDTEIVLPIRLAGLAKTLPQNRYRSLEAAETEFAQRVWTDASYVSRQLVADGQAVFSREDVDRYLAARVTDPAMVVALSERVEQHDDTLRVLSPDTANPLYTTAAHLALADEVAEMARGLACKDKKFDRQSLEGAVEAFTATRGYGPSPEQRAVLDGLRRRLVWVQGEAGSGKTTVMEIVRRCGEATGREVVGLTIAEAAARKLSQEAGFRTVNSARAQSLEAKGEQVITPGSIVVLDEVGMTSYAAMRYALTLARDRDCTVVGIGDGAQLPNIEAGSPHNAISRIARESGSYYELTEVRRQRADWHRDLVKRMGPAIRDGDEQTVGSAVEELGAHGVINLAPERTEAIERAAAWYVERVERHGVAEVLLLAGDKITGRHENETIRAAYGRAEAGPGFHTDDGVRTLVAGDRFVFLQNNKRVRVVNGDAKIVRHVMNGDVGTVQAVHVGEGGVRVEVELDRGEGRVVFDPRRYTSWDWGYALTVHKAQGATVEASAYVIDKSASAEMLHVAASRARGETRVFGSNANFADIGELAEHIAGRIRGKDDALLYEEVVARFGGPESVWANRVKRAMAEKNDPLRREHEREMRLRHERFERESADLRARSAGDAAGLRRGVAALLKEHAPESFVVWAAANKARVEYDADRTRGVREPEMREPERDREPQMRGPGRGDAPEQRNVRDHELTLDIARGRARQLDEPEQPEKIDDEPKQETPDDAGYTPTNTSDEPEIDDDLEMDHEPGLHL